jgi:hypothetical protein
MRVSTPSSAWSRLRRKPWLWPLALVSLLLPAAVALPAAHGATAVCSVNYTVNQWAGGFTADVKVTNLGAALNGWRLQWTYGGDQKVTSAWNAQVTQSGANVTAVNAAYNPSLPSGGSVDFGVQGTWSASDPTPTEFALNGTSCGQTGGTTSGTTSGTTGSTTTGTTGSTTTGTTGSTTTGTTGSTTTGTTGSTTSGTTGTTTTGTTGSTTTGTTGSTTSGTTGSTTGGTTPPPNCQNAVICTDFEDQTGSVPSGQWQSVFPDCQGTGAVSVDTSVAYSGTRSLRVDGKAGYCNHAFVAATKDLSSVGPVMYVRMRVRHTTALPVGHVAFVSMPDSSQGGKALRIGGQNSALQWNREIDDATLPAQSPAGVAQSVPLPTGRWVCLRFAIDTTKQSAQTWVDDQEVPGLHLDGVPTQDIDNQWLSRTTPPRPTALRLGWESYSTGDDTLWFDDVAVGASPIGC